MTRSHRFLSCGTSHVARRSAGVPRLRRVFARRIALFAFGVTLLCAAAPRSIGAPVARIMAVGDSITEGGATFSSYRYPLWQKLTAAGYAFSFVGTRSSETPAGPLEHEGYSGHTTEELATIVPEHAMRLKPDIVLLHSGHNHVAAERPIPGIVAATEKLIQAFRAANPKVSVLLAQVIPSGKLPKYSYIPELNRALAALATRLDRPKARVILVNQAAGFDWQTDTISDHVHPNERGAEKMAETWFAALSAVLPAPLPTAHAGPPDAGYRLVWADEFNGPALDRAAWDYRTDSKHWSTQLPANVSVHDGCLWLTLKKEKAGGKSYTGGGVISKRRFKYGYYEARFKVPPTKGWHTSFWLMASDGAGGTNPRVSVQELDICENDSVNLRGYRATTHRWLPSHVTVKGEWIATPDLAAEFHVWGCEFTPKTITYYFDGKPVETCETARLGEPSEQNIWLTAIASSLGPTDAVDDSQLPVEACYDYVRFYQRDAASPDD